MKRKNTVFAIITLLVYLFIFAPLVIVVMTSFNAGEYVAFPPEGFSLKWYAAVFQNKSFMDSFVLSLVVSTAATLLSLVVGVPGAYAVSRNEFPGKRFVKDLFFAPNFVPAVVLGFALYILVVVQFRLGIEIALLAGLSVSVITYTFRMVGTGIDKFDYAIEEAAMSLGASRVTVFFQVLLPNITSSMMGAFLMAFISAFNNVALTRFLTGPGIVTLPINMMSYLEFHYDPSISALSVLLMFMSLIIIFLSEKITNRKN